MKAFPPFRLDIVNQCLWRRSDAEDEERILLTPKAFSVLSYLVEHADRLISQNELLEAVWPGTFVQPEVLKYQIADIRNALGDRPKNPLFIETMPRRGYRFIASVSDTDAGQLSDVKSGRPGRLVGRDSETSALHACLAHAISGQPQIVFITGEPGIGKTALVDEFQRQAASVEPSIRIARGQCIEGYGGAEAYYPMLEALGQLCRGPERSRVVEILAAQAPTWLVQFPALLKREHRETLTQEILGATRDRMLREIREALDTLTSEAPLLIVFEDLQWADPSTINLISALARQRTPAKTMLIGTKRPVNIGEPGHPLKALKHDLLLHHLCQEITLAPLTQADVAEYLSATWLGGSRSDGLAELIHHQSEGNPLFMVALIDSLTESGLITSENGKRRLTVPVEEINIEVPENLRLIIEAQIAALTEEEQLALEAASVAGAQFSGDLVATAMKVHPELVEDRLLMLSRRSRIVRAAGTQELADGSVSQAFEFVHALYREVLYRRQTPARRASLHLRIGLRLEDLFSRRPHQVAAELAHHFEQGSDCVRAVKYLQVVAQTALRRHAPGEATAVWRHALDLCARLPDSKRAACEIAVLEKLASIYVVSFDKRALATYRTLRLRAAHYGLKEIEVHALIDMAYPLSWNSTRRCLVVLDRALRLAESSPDPVFRARARASCLVRRVWASGWSSRDAQDCRDAIEEIRQTGDRVVLAWHLIDCNFIRWCSSEYRGAHRDALESLSLLSKGDENRYSSFTHWIGQFVLPWSLLLLGRWGEALKETEDGIRMVDENGDYYRAQTLRLYQAWVHLEATDFASVLEICESLLPSLASAARTPWRRFCMVLAGLADVAIENFERALQRFFAVRIEMSRQTVIHDWYCRMLLECGTTELWLARGHLTQARLAGETFLDTTLATAERTWQARAWEANARIALAELDLPRAQNCIAQALATIDGFEVPLAAWRVHASASAVFEFTGSQTLAEHHREIAAQTIRQLADSLPPNHPLRDILLTAPATRGVLCKCDSVST